MCPVTLRPRSIFLRKEHAFLLHLFSQKRLFGSSPGPNLQHSLQPILHKSGLLPLKTLHLLDQLFGSFRWKLFNILLQPLILSMDSGPGMTRNRAARWRRHPRQQFLQLRSQTGNCQFPHPRRTAISAVLTPASVHT